MGAKTVCDGTGVEIPDETPNTGIFGHQYCDEARPIAEEYLAKVSELHTQVAAQFKASLEDLRDTYRAKLRELPDQP